VIYLFRLGLLVLMSLAVLLPARADAPILPQVTGPVILTITGLDATRFPGGSLDLDLGRMEALGTHEFATSSIWTDGVHTYRGVPLARLIGFLDLSARQLRLHALNDYAIDFPAAESGAKAPILAFQMDGKPMSVREKGPIWLVYPYDDDAIFRTDTIFSRSIWQLDRIDVLAER
jgi:hypothetical protein